MKYNKLGRKYVNLYTHCAICDCSLAHYQGLNPLNNEPDDLCTVCRKEVTDSILYHEDHKLEMELMEQFGWRSYVKEGRGDISSFIEKDYTGGSIDPDQGEGLFDEYE